jgi:hypothetical protein
MEMNVRILWPKFLIVPLLALAQPITAAEEKQFEQRSEKQQAKRNEAVAKLTPQSVAQIIVIQDEEMEPKITLSTEKAFQWKGGFTDNVRSDNFVRAFLDKDGDGAIYQVVQSLSYLYKRRRFDRVNVMLPAGLKLYDLTVIAEDVDCSIGICVYTDTVGFQLAEEEFSAIAELHETTPSAALKMRFKSSDNLDWNDDIAVVELAGLSQAIATWRAKLAGN